MALKPEEIDFVRVPLFGGHYSIIDKEDAELVLTMNWWRYASPATYYAISSKYLGDYKNTTIRLHRFILGAKEGEVVDHKNGNGLDNRRRNLRICTQKQNLWNSRKRPGTSSRFKGVAFDKERHSWIVRVGDSHIGRFANELVAATEYDKAVLKLRGEYAVTNFGRP